MSRAFNFSAGPAALPTAVLERAQRELLDFQGTGMSIMEVSHRGSTFLAVAEAAEARLRSLMGISEEYAVLFLQGGATMQFSAVPLNLSTPGQTVAYVNTGAWSKKAIKEAGRYANVVVSASSEGENFTTIPERASWNVPADAAYLHVCANETIGGVEFPAAPDAGGVPLVGDFSSTILSRPIDVNAWDVIYAGAQKNVGPAGLTLVIVKRELLDRARSDIPALLAWKGFADEDSMLNTPPTFSWYLAGLVFEWIEQEGGVAVMAERNARKAKTLYEAIDASDFYTAPVDPAYRSWMNVPFTLPDPSLDKPFLVGAEAAGLMNLKGHRSVGGMRASLYNAVGQDAVDALVAYMADFEASHG